MVLYSEFTYGSQFSEEKNGQEIRFLVPEILSKYKRSIFFWDALYQLLLDAIGIVRYYLLLENIVKR